MLIIFSPTKTMKPGTGIYENATAPRFMTEAAIINKALKELSRKQLASLMKISDSLAVENMERLGNWGSGRYKSNAALAVLAYDGESFRRLGANDFSVREMEFANRHFRILSGLYGVLKPTDLIMPYRVEMQTPLAINGHKNLYEAWNPVITNNLAECLLEIKKKKHIKNNEPILINLASTEYSKCVMKKTLGFPVLNMHFKEQRGDKLKVVSVFAKQARGLMARFIVKNKITDYNQLKGFKEEGYTFREDLSRDGDWLFSRAAQ